MELFLILAILILLILFPLAVLIFVIYPAFFGAPFQPTNSTDVKRMVRLANIQKGEKTVDLGSGSGTLVIAFAKAGAEAHGYEINPFLVWWSRRQIKKEGLKGKAFIHLKSFWKVNLHEYTVVSIFQIMYVMPGLERKLLRELKKGSRVVSNTWKFPYWDVAVREKFVRLYVK